MRFPASSSWFAEAAFPVAMVRDEI